MKLQYDFTFLGKSARILRHKRINGARSESKTDRYPNIIIDVSQKYDKALFMKFVIHELFEIGSFVLGCGYKTENPNKYDEFIVLRHMDLTNLCDAVQLAYEDIKNGIGD